MSNRFGTLQLGRESMWRLSTMDLTLTILDLKDNVITANNYDYNGNNNISNPFSNPWNKCSRTYRCLSTTILEYEGVAPKAKIYGYNLLGDTAAE